MSVNAKKRRWRASKSTKNYLIGYDIDNSGRVTAIYRSDESGAQYEPTYYNYTKL